MRTFALLFIVSASSDAAIPVDCVTEIRLLIASDAAQLGISLESSRYPPISSSCHEVWMYVPMEIDGKKGSYANIELLSSDRTVAGFMATGVDTIVGKHAYFFRACPPIDYARIEVMYGPYCKDMKLDLGLMLRDEKWVFSK